MALKKACSCSGITNLRRAEFSQQLLSHYHTKQKLVSVEEKKKKSKCERERQQQLRREETKALLPCTNRSSSRTSLSVPS